MMSSLYLPVIFTMPLTVIMPLSPEWSQPSLSIASLMRLGNRKCGSPSTLRHPVHLIDLDANTGKVLQSVYTNWSSPGKTKLHLVQPESFLGLTKDLETN